MKQFKNSIFFLALLSICSSLDAQTTIKGYIRDAKSKEILPAANIQIVGTMQGTITNKEGRFSLELDQVPAKILISYIGYESKQLSISNSNPKLQNILLKPIILESEAIVVTAEDPAMGIMREVIKRKKVWREKLNTYQANAYSRLVLENDSGIVSVAESISEAFWDRKEGPREVIKSKRQTGNMSEEGNFANSSYIPNFYDDDIKINGFNIIGPTNQSALNYYDYKLIGQRKLDDKIVFDIELIPTSKLQPTFIGRISVLDEDFAMIDVDLKPNETILFPPPIQSWNLFYKQQFSNYGQEFWLPIDVRIDGDIKIGFTGLQFPKIIYSQLSHLTDYLVNVELPDSLYKNDEIITTDSSTITLDTLFTENSGIIPLSVDEEEAYETLDSTMTLEKAFQPTGMLARFVKVESDANQVNAGEKKSWLSDFGPQLWFNRVDELHLGINYEPHFTDRLETKVTAAYKTGLKKWGYNAEFGYWFGKRHTTSIKTKYLVGTESQFSSENYSKTLVSPLPLFARQDYFNYYWTRAFRAELGQNFRKIDFEATIGFNDEWHSNVYKTTDFNIVNSDKKLKNNPTISTGNLRSFDLRLIYGEDRVPFGVVGQNRVELFVEHSSEEYFSSDFEFTRYLLTLDLRLNTFLKRRLLPNALDMTIMLGTSSGDLPVQRFFALDGNLYLFSPFGVFRTLSGKAYPGDKVAALFWEHNFRTVPFELIGLDYLAKKGLSIIIHGAHGRSWIEEDHSQEIIDGINYTNDFHHEVGISLNGLFGIIRIDATQRLDKPGFYVGAGFTRFF